MTKTTDKKIAVVTGANRGLGLEIARQLARDHRFHVVLAARDATKVAAVAAVAAAAAALRDDGLDVVGHVLDITRADSAAAFAEWIKDTYGMIDVLVNNAGILLERIYGETENIEADGLDVDVDLVATILDTNLLGPLRVTQKLVKTRAANQQRRAHRQHVLADGSVRLGRFGHGGLPVVQDRAQRPDR